MGSIEGKKSLDIDPGVASPDSLQVFTGRVASWLVRRRPGREVSGLSPWLERE